MKRKAQIQTQILIYVFALIVVSLILIFGVKAIGGFRKDTQKVANVAFQTDFKALIANVAAQYGSVEKADIMLSTDYIKACFVDKQTDPAHVSYAFIKDALSTDENVFLVKSPSDIESFKTTTPIQVNAPGHYYCVPNTNGKITFTITGKSRFAEISP